MIIKVFVNLVFFSFVAVTKKYHFYKLLLQKSNLRLNQQFFSETKQLTLVKIIIIMSLIFSFGKKLKCNFNMIVELKKNPIKNT